MSCRKTLVFWRCMGFVTVMCGLPSMTLAVIGPFHPGFDHGQLWAQAPRGHLSLDLCDRRNENNTQESWQLVPAVSFPASGTTEQEKVSYCKTTHHRSGRLWKVQVRSCVSINISWCFSLESGYKLIPPLAEMFTRTLEVPSFASSPNCPNWVWFDYFFQWHPRRASFADIRAHHFYWGANMWPELCPWLEALPHISQSLSVLSHPALSLWGCEKLICLDPLTLAEGLLYQRTVPWMNDLGFSPVTGHQKHYSHFRLHGKIY